MIKNSTVDKLSTTETSILDCDFSVLDDNENLLYGVSIEELKGFTSYEVLSDEWRELEEKL